MKNRITFGGSVAGLAVAAALLSPAADLGGRPVPVRLAATASRFCQALGVPAYFPPGPLWDSLAASVPATAHVVLNPDSGPGTDPDPDYQAAVGRARAAGARVLGYVPTGWGRRDLEAVEADIANYERWYGVDGIFLDETSSSASDLGYYRRLADLLHARRRVVALNPGTHPDEAYAALSDLLVTFEGDRAAYQSLTLPGWTSSYPPDRFWHLVYGVARQDARRVLDRARELGAGSVYVTDDRPDNPWDTLPSYWSAEQRRISTANPGSCPR